MGQLNPTDEEKCLSAIHNRTCCSVESLLALKELRHFQAIASISRTIFELAVDIRLLKKIPNATAKMIAGVEVEKLQSAEKIVNFSKTQEVPDIDVFRSYVDREGPRIRAENLRLWSTAVLVSHWSNKKLKERTDILGGLFQSAYRLHYPLLSWYTHSGLTGVANMSEVALTTVSTRAIRLAADFYKEVLSAMIEHFRINSTDPEILDQMKIEAGIPFLPSELRGT